MKLIIKYEEDLTPGEAIVFVAVVMEKFESDSEMSNINHHVRYSNGELSCWVKRNKASVTVSVQKEEIEALKSKVGE